VHSVGFRGEDDLAAGAEILQSRQSDLAYRRTRLGEQLDRYIQRLDLFGIARNIPGVEMADDAEAQASDVLAE
jgi:hypothetical protein